MVTVAAMFGFAGELLPVGSVLPSPTSVLRAAVTIDDPERVGKDCYAMCECGEFACPLDKLLAEPHAAHLICPLCLKYLFEEGARAGRSDGRLARHDAAHLVYVLDFGGALTRMLTRRDLVRQFLYPLWHLDRDATAPFGADGARLDSCDSPWWATTAAKVREDDAGRGRIIELVVALGCDGFRPGGMSTASQPHSTFAVVAIFLSLPPWLRYREPFLLPLALVEPRGVTGKAAHSVQAVFAIVFARIDLINTTRSLRGVDPDTREPVTFHLVVACCVSDSRGREEAMLHQGTGAVCGCMYCPIRGISLPGGKSKRYRCVDPERVATARAELEAATRLEATAARAVEAHNSRLARSKLVDAQRRKADAQREADAAVLPPPARTDEELRALMWKAALQRHQLRGMVQPPRFDAGQLSGFGGFPLLCLRAFTTPTRVAPADAMHLCYNTDKMLHQWLVGTDSAVVAARGDEVARIDANLARALVLPATWIRDVAAAVQGVRVGAELAGAVTALLSSKHGKSADSMKKLQYLYTWLLPQLVTVPLPVRRALYDFVSVVGEVLRFGASFESGADGWANFSAAADDLERRLWAALVQCEAALPVAFLSGSLHQWWHVMRDVRQHGPVWLFWMFGVERALKGLKNSLEVAAGHVEVVMIKAVARRTIDSLVVEANRGEALAAARALPPDLHLRRPVRLMRLAASCLFAVEEPDAVAATVRLANPSALYPYPDLDRSLWRRAVAITLPASVQLDGEESARRCFAAALQRAVARAAESQPAGVRGGLELQAASEQLEFFQMLSNRNVDRHEDRRHRSSCVWAAAGERRKSRTTAASYVLAPGTLPDEEQRGAAAGAAADGGPPTRHVALVLALAHVETLRMCVAFVRVVRAQLVHMGDGPDGRGSVLPGGAPTAWFVDAHAVRRSPTMRVEAVPVSSLAEVATLLPASANTFAQADVRGADGFVSRHAPFWRVIATPRGFVA